MRYTHEPHHHHHRHDKRRHGGPGGPGGFGFGPGGFGGPGGPGFGPGGPGGRGGGRGRRRRGDVRLGVLLLLKESPANGYQLIQSLAEKSEGMWTPSPGSVYPTLAQLQDEGLIAGTQTAGESGTTYTLTAQGGEYLDGLGEVTAPWEDGPDKNHPVFQFRHAVGGVMKAAWQVAQEGDPAKLSRAQEILTQARKDLYKILAEDDTPAA